MISFSTQEIGMVKVYILDISNGDVWRPDIFNGAHQRSCPQVAKLVMDRWDIYVDIQNENFEIYKYDEKSDLDVPLTGIDSMSLGPSRSMDEGWLAFYSQRTGNWEIFIANITGVNQWNISQNPADDIQPAWEPY
jgi:Tol biopolymer transport system component